MVRRNTRYARAIGLRRVSRWGLALSPGPGGRAPRVPADGEDAVIHYYDGEGAICGESPARNWTLNRTFVTCSACATFISHEGRERSPWPAPRLHSKPAIPVRVRY